MDVVYLLVGLLVLLIVVCGVKDTMALRRREAIARREDTPFDGE